MNISNSTKYAYKFNCVYDKIFPLTWNSLITQWLLQTHFLSRRKIV